jgi:hypothetical protein
MRIKVRWVGIGLMLSILVATGAPQTHVRAQDKTQYFLFSPPVSLGPGQSIRFTLFLPDGVPIRAHAKLFDEHNLTILESPVASIPAGLPYTWTYTHRQVSEVTKMFGVNNFRFTLDGATDSSQKIDTFVFSMQTINDSTGGVTDGTTQTLLVGERWQKSFDTDQAPGTITQNYMASVVPGQPLLISALNPAEPKTFGEPITFTATVTIDSGVVIATSPVITIPSNEFRTVSFNTTNWTPDPLTGRANVRVTIVVSAPSGRDPLNIKRFFVIDPNALITMWEAGDQCLVFFLGGRS